ncbi:MAG: hypothetical protein PHN74_00935 [Candidatus Pacebacteria bacterium]|nr:hypothetical protein [Candidatus Paceibacterota bacterium]
MTEILTDGQVFYLIFALPGFILIWSFRLFFLHRKKWSGWEWTSWSVFWGIINTLIFEWFLREHPEQIPKVFANPIIAAFILSIFAFLFIAFLWILIISFKHLFVTIMDSIS